MSLYRKKLGGVDELKREKRRLQATRKNTATASFFTSGLLSPSQSRSQGAGQTGQTGGSPGWFDILSGLLGSRTVLDSALAIGVPLTRFLPAKMQQRFLKAFAREFLGGYLRWKILSFGVKAGRMFIRSLRKK